MTEVIDYAYPCMMAEDGLKRAHVAMLDKQYDEAIGAAMTTLVETRIMLNSIRHMKEQEDALR